MKRYVAKVYNLDGSFKKTIDETSIVSKITYSSNINGGQGNLNLTVNEAFNYLDINTSDFIKVFLYDENYNDGVLLYTGIIETINRLYKSSENRLQFVCYGLGSLLTRSFYESGSSYIFSKTDEPGDIVREIINDFNSKYPGNWLNTSGIEDYGSDITVDFDYTKHFGAINSISDITGFNWFIGADGNVIFKEKDTTVKHRFTAGKDLQNLTIEEDTFNLQNKIFVKYDSGVLIFEDITSQSNYGLRTEELESTDLATATDIGTNYLTNNKDPKQKITLEINNRYNLESLNPLDKIRVNNIDYSINNLQINKLEYNQYAVTLYLEEYNSVAKVLNK